MKILNSLLIIFAAIIVILANDLCAQSKGKLKPKCGTIAVHIIKIEEINPFPDSEFNKINNYILAHFNNSRLVSLVSYNQISGSDFLLNGELRIFKENQQAPDSSMILINLSLNILNKKLEEKFEKMGRLGYYFPTKIDTMLNQIDKMIEKNCKSKIPPGKCAGIICTAIISAILLGDTIWNQEDRKKLPPAPDFPKPYQFNKR